MAVNSFAMGVGKESHAEIDQLDFGEIVKTSAPNPAADMLIICEHASNHIPAALHDLGLTKDVLESHVAWDPGALGVATSLAQKFSAVLIESTVSRLVYDCNRAPDAASAVPERSEAFEIIGNKGLSNADRELRIKGVFEPFSSAVSDEISRRRDTLQLMITVHSFTPIFNGRPRAVEIGILHGEDPRLAEALMETRPRDKRYDIRLNEPYAASDGVTHTLDTHGTRNGLPNAMIEIRNDLIETSEAQEAMGAYIAPWIESARARLASDGAGS